MTRKWVALYQGHREQDRYTYRAVLADHSYDLEKVPTNALEFIQWVSRLLHEVEPEHQVNAVLTLHNNECDECSSERATFSLYVDREENDEEYRIRMEKAEAAKAKAAISRAASAARAAEEKERKDRAEFERLKTKYAEGTPTSLAVPKLRTTTSS